MNPLAGKSTTERNKIIAAVVLGFVSLAALYFAFGQSLFSGSTTVAVNAKPTPTPLSSSSSSSSKKIELPSQQQQNLEGSTTEIVYHSGIAAPEPGRNIFAFYEPPPPCDPNRDPAGCVKPTPVKTPPTPTPTPTPPIHLEFVTPQTIYAGAGSFRLEVNGDKFEPSAKIYFRGTEMATQFVSDKKMVANVPSMMISLEGQAPVIVQTPDGKYSEQIMVSIQPPPKPQFQYVGMIARARHNNDTAYFMEQGKQLPTGARLNDVVGGRFRLVSISSNEAVFEDVNLGFKHKVQLFRPPPGSTTSTTAPGGFRPGGFPNDPNTYVPYTPNVQQILPGQEIPGIPNNLPRAQPPQNVQRPQPKKGDKDEDDDGDGGGGENS
jgi:hypothetical protein